MAAGLGLAFIFVLSYTFLSVLNAVAATFPPRPLPRMLARLGPASVRWIKAAHLLLCIFWVGAAASVVMLSIMAGDIADNEPAYAAVLRSMCVLDNYIITPASFGCVFSGLLLSALSSWGIARHKWIVAKQALSFWAIIIGVFVIRSRLHASLEAFQIMGQAAMEQPVYHQHSPANITMGSVQMGLLLALTLLSVIKPWRKG